jgi:hypothetical protein|eukprot:SAG25_NODE_24_length_22161_cov_23.692405_15_plen_78_part_00
MRAVVMQIREAYSFLSHQEPIKRAEEKLKVVPRHIGTLAVAVVEARGLPKMDRFGNNDAYCLLTWGNKENGLLERTR